MPGARRGAMCWSCACSPPGWACLNSSGTCSAPCAGGPGCATPPWRDRAPGPRRHLQHRDCGLFRAHRGVDFPSQPSHPASQGRGVLRDRPPDHPPRIPTAVVGPRRRAGGASPAAGPGAARGAQFIRVEEGGQAEAAWRIESGWPDEEWVQSPEAALRVVNATGSEQVAGVGAHGLVQPGRHRRRGDGPAARPRPFRRGGPAAGGEDRGGQSDGALHRPVRLHTALQPDRRHPRLLAW